MVQDPTNTACQVTGIHANQSFLLPFFLPLSVVVVLRRVTTQQSCGRGKTFWTAARLHTMGGGGRRRRVCVCVEGGSHLPIPLLMFSLSLMPVAQPFGDFKQNVIYRSFMLDLGSFIPLRDFEGQIYEHTLFIYTRD